MSTKNCHKTIDALPDYLSGDIKDKAKDFVEKHLDECSNCRAKLDNLHVTMDIFHFDEGFIASPDLEEKIIKNIETLPSENQSDFFRFKSVRGIAAVVAMIIGMYIGINFGREIIKSEQQNDQLIKVFAGELMKEDSFESQNILFNYFEERK